MSPVDSVNNVELVKAMSAFAWPVLAAIAFYMLFPTLREMVKSRAFTVKVGKYELTVQQGAGRD